MIGPIKRFDPWATAAFFVWTILLSMGLFPISTFTALREVSGVVTQTAWVNHTFMLALALGAFVGFFGWQRAEEGNLPPVAAQAVGMQLALCSLVAFLPMPISDFLLVSYRPLLFSIFLWSVLAIKCMCWLYLWSLFFRYYVLHNYGVFGKMTSAFPSGRVEGTSKIPPPPIEEIKGVAPDGRID